MSKARKEKGRWGEQAAAHYLEKNGFAVRERNVHLSCAEIDIVAEKDGCLYFVEVKSRSSAKFGSPVESINSPKKHKMFLGAEAYLSQRDYHGDCSFLVVAVDLNTGNVELIEDILD